jgi:trimeric intracellular cation channel
VLCLLCYVFRRYAINYSPFDIVYKITKFLPVKVVIYCMKEIQRVSKVHHGIHFAAHIYPGGYVIMCVVGVLKGEQKYTFL